MTELNEWVRSLSPVQLQNGMNSVVTSESFDVRKNIRLKNFLMFDLRYF